MISGTVSGGAGRDEKLARVCHETSEQVALETSDVDTSHDLIHCEHMTVCTWID